MLTFAFDDQKVRRLVTSGQWLATCHCYLDTAGEGWRFADGEGRGEFSKDALVQPRVAVFCNPFPITPRLGFAPHDLRPPHPRLALRLPFPPSSFLFFPPPPRSQLSNFKSGIRPPAFPRSSTPFFFHLCSFLFSLSRLPAVKSQILNLKSAPCLPFSLCSLLSPASPLSNLKFQI